MNSDLDSQINESIYSEGELAWRKEWQKVLDDKDRHITVSEFSEPGAKEFKNVEHTNNFQNKDWTIPKDATGIALYYFMLNVM